MAQKNIKEFREKNITKQDNAEAARIILQSWLDRNEKK
jgi:RNase H-fold protein (predicted Holliday junction resolvase)